MPKRVLWFQSVMRGLLAVIAYVSCSFSGHVGPGTRTLGEHCPSVVGDRNADLADGVLRPMRLMTRWLTLAPSGDGLRMISRQTV